MEEQKIKLKKKFEDLLSGHSPAERDFLIQYSVFCHIRDDEWICKCVEACNDEAIIDMEIDYSDHTFITFVSYKGNYENWEMEYYSDLGGCSREGLIYTCDLFDDYEPKDFVGTVTTRGSWYGYYTIK